MDVSTGQESRSRDSYENFTESSFVADMLDRLVSASFQRQRSSANVESSKAAVVKVGVISAYKAQVDRIKQDLSRRRLYNDDGSAIGNVHVDVSDTLILYLDGILLRLWLSESCLLNCKEKD